MTSIADVELHTQYLCIKDELIAAVNDVFERSLFIEGPHLRAFEQEFADYCGVNHGIGVGCGTDALTLALMAAGVGEGDEVITVPNSVYATARAIQLAGATPVFVDVDHATSNIDVTQISSAISPRTRAIVPVHLYGYPADMDSISRSASEHNLVVIEDACQAVGSTYKGKRAGSLGHFGCFSLYPSKNLGSYGDGGIIVTDDWQAAERLREMRWFGQYKRDYFRGQGINSRLDELQAAMLRVKLRHLDEWNQTRNRLAQLYTRILSQVSDSVVTPPTEEHVCHNYHLYVIRCRCRDDLMAYLQEEGIKTQIHYRLPLHLQKPLANLGYRDGDFPVVERNAREILSLPMYPELSEESVMAICSFIVQFYKNKQDH